MASGRFLSTSIAEDDRLSKLSLMAEFIYLKTIPHLDRDGMISGKPGLLYSRVCPTREEMFGNLQSLIDEWIKVGLVTRFDSAEGPVLFFPGFLKNNNLPHYDRERASRFPAPPGYERTVNGLIVEGTEPPVKQPKKSKTPEKYSVTPPEVQDEVQELVLDTEQDEGQDKGVDKVTDEVLENESQEQEQEQEQEEDKDKEEEQKDEEETHAREPSNPVDAAWEKHYVQEVPTHIRQPLDELVAKCGVEAVIHGIEVTAKSKSHNFLYIAKSARNYVPEPVTTVNGYGLRPVYEHAEVDFMPGAPGVHPLTPSAAANPPPLPRPMPTDDPWTIALAELLPTLSSQAALWLKDSELVMSEIAGEPLCEILVKHPNANVEWLMRQAEPLIRKKMGSLIGKRVNVGFVLVDAVTP